MKRLSMVQKDVLRLKVLGILEEDKLALVRTEISIKLGYEQAKPLLRRSRSS